LELNLALEPRQAGQFIDLTASQAAEKGKQYRSGDREDDVFNLPFYLFGTSPIQSSKIKDRVLRILFCDPAGEYPWEPGCESPYSAQLSDVEKLEMKELLKKREEILS